MTMCEDCRRYMATETRAGISACFSFCTTCARRWDRITAEIDARIAALHSPPVSCDKHGYVLPCGICEVQARSNASYTPSALFSETPDGR